MVQLFSLCWKWWCMKYELILIIFLIYGLKFFIIPSISAIYYIFSIFCFLSRYVAISVSDCIFFWLPLIEITCYFPHPSISSAESMPSPNDGSFSFAPTIQTWLSDRSRWWRGIYSWPTKVGWRWQRIPQRFVIPRTHRQPQWLCAWLKAGKSILFPNHIQDNLCARHIPCISRTFQNNSSIWHKWVDWRVGWAQNMFVGELTILSQGNHGLSLLILSSDSCSFKNSEKSIFFFLLFLWNQEERRLTCLIFRELSKTKEKNFR